MNLYTTFGRAILVGLLFLLSACATTGAVDPRDPYENFNRSVFSFNEFMDEKLFEPVTKGYQRFVPELIREAISNFFSNLNDVTVIINDILQFKFAQAISDITRFILNTTIGLLGLVDVATGAGLEKHNEDFGQTLGVWGFGSGPYLVTPFFGPSSFRDVSALVIDGILINPTSQLNNTTPRMGLMSLNYIDFKVEYLQAMEMVGEASFDEYEFLKNAYFQKRYSQIHDDQLPPFPEEFEELDE